MRRLFPLALLFALFAASAADKEALTTSAVQTVTGAKTWSGTCKLLLAGSTSGTTCLQAPAIAGSTTAIVFPAAAGTLATLAGTETFTNKSIDAGQLTGTIVAGRMPALTGDVTSSAGAVATTLATVNSNVGSFGDGTHVGAFTVNGKGLITAAASVVITGAAPTGSAGGDLTGTFPNPTVDANKITNAKAAQMAAHTIKGNNTGSLANAIDLTVTQATADLDAMVGDSGSGGTKGLVPAPASGDAAAGKFLKADGTFAVPAGGATPTGTGFVHITSGAQDGAATAIDLSGAHATGTLAAARMPALTGDVTTSAGAVATTIAANAVTNAKSAQMATLTLKGNNTGGASDPLDLTVAQVNAVLPVFTSLLNGSVPLSGGGTTNFLRADGTWAAAAGSFAGGTLTSTLVLRTGGTASGSDPIKFVSGSLLTAPVAGTVEYLTDKWYATIATGTARKELTLNDAALTSGRVPVITTNGRLTDGTDLTKSSQALVVVSGSPSSSHPAYSGLHLSSGSSSAYTAFSVGRTVAEGYFGVAGAAGDFLSGTAAGDTAIFAITGKKIHFGGSGVGGATIGVLSSAGLMLGTNIAPRTKMEVFITSGIASFTGANIGHMLLSGPTASGNNFATLDFTETTDPTIATARIGAKFTSSGSQLHFGISNNYGSGITHVPLIIDQAMLFTFAEGAHHAYGTTTGTKHGTSTTQKQGWWNATPVVQSTGYGTPTNGAKQASFDATSITLPNLAAAVAQLIVDLKTYGLVGN